ncbi:MAG TPA: thiamine pyrophosphate-dependent enzyme [Bacteroidales bacterium]|nr:thiamine pyrophosphate-dependent enzyme [Bacteroidales bacterium]HOR82088.1 thiamine pyrophosphate-dependent enzyme [Bacteroidales bacterium]HPJ91378.1 thiamine pyrophosphate-dependent enzyme [Bacteroidales bacterium]HQB19383.1 thiamine pyrophosphate-dependent enzyme [Bacteroidales bacterium]
MQKLLLLGDEAIAQAALDAGISGIYAYPGTPSTEIMEYIQVSKKAADNNVHRQWSVNEKTALEAAIGMSYAGKRAIVCMKHVGLNVAADAFMNVAITGTNGGLVILSADDPSMHSSQNEQDSRYYGQFAFIPVFEPSNQQEAYDMTVAAFDFSEKHNVAVLLRITTRLAHSRAGVKCHYKREQNKLKFPDNPRRFILLPAIARKQYIALLEKQEAIRKDIESSTFCTYIDGEDKSMGIITSGIAFNYLQENYQDKKCPYPIVKITQYPLPLKYINKLADECDSLMLIEEGYPLIEQQIKGLLNRGLKVKGRLDGSIPRVGELNANIIARALGLPDTQGEAVPDIVVPRPPALCTGCPHTDTYKALNEAIEPYGKGRVFADIGCYTLGALPPHNAIFTCVDMGASITMAKGATDAGLNQAVAVIGDSTFCHSGITSLFDCVMENTPLTVFILDNSTTAMTGGQKSHASGKIENICLGLGVDKEHIHVIKPLPKEHDKNVEIIAKELKHQGVSVIIPERECIQTLKRKTRTQK